MESCLVGSPASLNVSPARCTANFHPSIWCQSLMSYEFDEATLCEWREKAATLKTEVLKMLMEDDSLPNKRRSTKLSLIDALQRLGVAYHFEREIEDLLAHIFTPHQDLIHHEAHGEENLYTLALKFRLLRERGYNITCDAFRKFTDNNGKFHKSLSDDVDGLLSLYEASHLRVQGEAILDEALSFTTSSLESLVPSLTPSLAKQVRDALYRPLRKRLPRSEARNYLSIYEQDEHHSEVVLHFAKLDFSILQKMYQKELSIMSKWYIDLDCARKFPFARDRLVEGYFWTTGVYFEPQYTMGRRFITQVIAITSIIDDMYDAYGTKEELQLFTDAVDRWDVAAIVHLPEYMKPCYQLLLDIFGKLEEEMIKQGKSCYGVQSAKQAINRLSRAYMEERKWLDIQELPTYEEYMKVALTSCTYPFLSIASLVWMDDAQANEQVFDWLIGEPKLVKAVSTICRLMDDIMSHKFEQERGHPPSATECYTVQYGVSEEEAYDVFRKEVEDAWKHINEAFLRPSPVTRSYLLCVLNLARVVEAMYKEGDGYTIVTPAIKETIASLLFRSLEE